MTSETYPHPPEPAPPSDEARPTPLRRNPFFWAAVAGLITIPLLRPLLRHVPDPPAVIAALPAFSLIDQDGQPFGSEELRGQVYIVNTFFTSCRSVCPGMMRAMKGLQERIAHEQDARGRPLAIKLVSVTVDPVNDTPAVLRDYAQEYQADFGRWTFLTGPEQAVRELVVHGLMTDMGEREVSAEDADLIEISHASRLVLVDDGGNIRGYYGFDEAGADEAYCRALRVHDTMD